MPGSLFDDQSTESKARGFAGLFVSTQVFRRLISTGLDLLFPPRCAGCGQVDTHWCHHCQAEISAASLTPRTFAPGPLADIASTGEHTGKLQKAIHALKYENARTLAEYPLSERLRDRFLPLNWGIDIIVPVPLHTDRLRERGYNQAHLLGEALAKHLMLPVVPAAVRRPRATRPQVGLSAAERLENVANAFMADHTLVAGQTILLIDDVYTTGATLSACAAAALEAGARQVYGLTVTVAQDS